MVLTKEEIEGLKSQLKKQVDHLSPDKKIDALKQIDSLSTDALESLVEEQKSAPRVYRKIIEKEIIAVVVGENPHALAVLDNKPISKGHVVIIPKKEALTPKDLPKEAFDLASQLSEKIISNLKPKSTKLHTETKFGESIINLIPIYDKDLDINSQRIDASPEDLQKVKKEIEVIKIEKKPEVIKIEKVDTADPVKIKRRIA